MLPPVILILALVITLITAIVGLCKGFKRFYPSLAVIAGSAVVALIVTLITKNTIAQIAAEVIRQLIESGEEAAILTDLTVAMPTAGDFINNAPAALAAPFVFAVIFGIVVVFADIVRAIVTAIIRGGKKRAAEPAPTAVTVEASELTSDSDAKVAKRNNRLIGLAAGVLGGLAVAFCLLLPFIGYMGMANTTLTGLEQTSPETLEAVFVDGSEDNYNLYIKPILADPYVKLSYTLGGKLAFNVLTSVKLDGESYPISRLTGTALSIFGHVNAFVDEEAANYGDEQIAAIEGLAADIGDDPLLKNLAAEFVSGLAGAWEKGESFLGIEPVQAEGEFAPVLDKLVASFATVNSTTIAGDIKDVSDVAAALIEYDVVAALADENADIKQIITTPGFITELCTAVQKSPRLEPVFFEVAKLGVTMVADAVGIPADESAAAGKVTVQDIRAELNEVSPADAEAESRLFEAVVTAAVAVVDSLGGEESNLLYAIDAQATQDVMVNLSKTETFGDAVPLLLHGVCQSEMLEGTGFSGEGLYNDLMAGGFDNISNTLQTVKHTVKMFETLAAKPIATKPSTGGSTAGSAGSSSGSGSSGSTTPSGGATTTDTEQLKADVKEEIEWIVTNMTPTTSTIITSQITEETVKNYGVSEQSAAPVSNLITNMFESMANETELTQEEYENESSAITHLFSVATDLSTSSSGGNIFGESVASAADITDTVLNSKVVSDALLNTVVDESGEIKEDPLALEIELTEDDKTMLVDALNDYSTANLPQSETKEEDIQKITALAAVFNINISIDANGFVTYLGK